MHNPTLLFFRSKSSVSANNVGLISSLQSIESSFFLIALNRYPHALVTYASAIESVIQASKIKTTKNDGLYALLEKARKYSDAIAQLPEKDLEGFRLLRNKVTHNGFSPKDVNESVRFYLDVGIPLLQLIYHYLHSFNLVKRLFQKYADLIEKGKEIYQRVKSIGLSDITYCLNPFRHFIRWHFKQNFPQIGSSGH